MGRGSQQLVSEPYDPYVGTYGSPISSSSGHGVRRGSPEERRRPAEEPQYGWGSPRYGWGSSHHGYGWGSQFRSDTPAMEPPSPPPPPAPDPYGMTFASPSPFYTSPPPPPQQQWPMIPPPQYQQQSPTMSQPYANSWLSTWSHHQQWQYPSPAPDPYGYPSSPSTSPWYQQPTLYYPLPPQYTVAPEPNGHSLPLPVPYNCYPQHQMAPYVFDGMPVRVEALHKEPVTEICTSMMDSFSGSLLDDRGDNLEENRGNDRRITVSHEIGDLKEDVMGRCLQLESDTFISNEFPEILSDNIVLETLIHIDVITGESSLPVPQKQLADIDRYQDVSSETSIVAIEHGLEERKWNIIEVRNNPYVPYKSITKRVLSEVSNGGGNHDVVCLPTISSEQASHSLNSTEVNLSLSRMSESCQSIPNHMDLHGAFRDPSKIQAPMCTVYVFPHNIGHCLSWARSEFGGFLEKTLREVKVFLADPSKYASSMKSANDAQARDLLEGVMECLDKVNCEIFQDCITGARLKIEVYFSNPVKQLTFTFPEDTSTITGAPFWVDLTSRVEAFGIPIPELAKNPKKLDDVPRFPKSKEELGMVWDPGIKFYYRSVL